ncbi:protein-disulfide reductase DsbD [Neiella marina]|uniref:Thiol:disulfide interchange protein DsbD n=1 Tax=Neiella holothuriorum TaxID=2870530 RepID=A0ABS7EJK0_9GAMM|nr:protein-disulfide reductase DsbD [Neiella holothuriorum]MBW8192505.1 protein-disulfide reductase DsbD [Neiella holothuriorum]
MPKSWWRVLLASLCLTLLSFNSWANSLSFLQDTPEFLPEEKAFVFAYDVIEPGKLEVFWQIEDGYYLYKEKLKFELNGQIITPATLPPAKPHEDEFFGITDVYYHSLTVPLTYTAQNSSALTVTYMGCAEAGLCYPPTKQKISLPATLSSTAAASASQASLADSLATDSNVATLGLFFLLGLGLAFTPCVFPMYPILSSVIAGNKQASKSQAFALSFTYVQGMALTYTLLGLLVASFGMQLQAAFQHPAVLIGLSLLFGLLALSMFGVFNLQLPASLRDRLQQTSEGMEGGKFGPVFGLGVIAGLVASPCTTAPLSAALLYVGQSGDLLFGGSALYLLSLGMGLPLLVVGTVGAKLLPKSGQWMNVVKHLLGFMTLAVPVFLLERMIPEPASAALWALLLLITASYLLFALRQVTRPIIGTLGYALAIITLAGASYFAMQVLPSSITPNQNISKDELGFITVTNQAELAEQLAAAKRAGQPALVDFYADWCVACKEFDKYTFPDPNVRAELADWRLIRIDVTASTLQDIELLEHYNILGLPSLLLFSANGDELVEFRIAGFLKPAPFILHIQSTAQ